MEWIVWALSEGAAMGAVKVFGHSAMGPFVWTVRDALLATGLTGLLQAFIAALVIVGHRNGRRPSILVSAGYINRITVFAFWAGLATVCAYYAFINGARADVGANTFIVAVLPIFGTALVERCMGGPKWRADQRLGFTIALIAALMVTSPALRPGNNPIWILISLGTAIGATGTRLEIGNIRKWEKREGLTILNPWLLQLWGGGMMAGLCLAPIPFLGIEGLFAATSFGFWQALIVVAVGNIAWWTFRLWAVPQGIPLAVKELVAGSMYLASATIVSHICPPYDVLPAIKLIGIALFVPAFFCAQKEVRLYCIALFKRPVLHSKPVLEQTPVVS